MAAATFPHRVDTAATVTDVNTPRDMGTTLTDTGTPRQSAAEPAPGSRYEAALHLRLTLMISVLLALATLVGAGRLASSFSDIPSRRRQLGYSVDVFGKLTGSASAARSSICAIARSERLLPK